MNSPHLTLALLPNTFAVCRLASDAPLPDWASAGSFYSITRTRDELSVVCPQEQVPAGIQAEKDWRCLKVQGPLDFALTGILVSLIAPLADAGISIFALSTFDTDYVMVKQADESRAITVLTQAGHHVQENG